MKIYGLFILMIVTFSCSSQKSKYQSHEQNQVIESEDCDSFHRLYENMDDGEFYKEELYKFYQVKNGILFYRYLDGLEHGELVVLEFQDEQFNLSTRNIFQKKVLSLAKDYENVIRDKVNAFEKVKCYTESSKIISANNYYFMLVLKNEVVVTQYLIHGNISFKKTTENSDLNTSKDLLEIMYRISFGNISN